MKKILNKMKEWIKKFDKKKIKLVVIVIVVAILVTLFVIFGMPAVNYGLAQSYYEKGQYDKSINCYLKIIDYRDSKDKLELAYFAYGKKLLEDEKFIDAKKKFEKSDDNLSKKYVKYIDAIILIKDNNPEGAIGIFESLEDFEYSKEYLKEAKYLYGNKLFEEANYSTAKTYYKQVLDYKDSKDKVLASDFMLIEEEYKEGNLSTALKLYKEFDQNYEYDGIKVSDRINKLNEYANFVNMTGKWSGSGKVEVRQYWKYDYSWESWYSSYSDTISIKAIIKEDGSVNIKGTASFYSYTNYSTISSYLKGKTISVPINITVKKGEKIPTTIVKYPALVAASGQIGYATVTYSGGQYKLSFTLDDQNYSQNFRELYMSNITYNKKIS